jgi:hypothetical protein
MEDYGSEVSLPHMTREERDAFERMSAIIGEDATNALLRTTKESQLAAVRAFMLQTISASGSRGLKPLKIDVSKYTGHERENLLKWFMELKLAFVARQLEDNSQQVAFALAHLSGRARSWAFGKAMGNSLVFPTMDALKKAMLEAFQPPKSEFRSRQRLLAVQQGRRPLHDYVQEVRELVADIVHDPVDTATQVSVFLNGLRPGSVRTQLFRAYPDSLETAISLALQEDFSHRQTNNLPTSTFSRQAARTENGPTPMEIDSIQATSRGNPSARTIRCFRCNHIGHIARNCRGATGQRPTVAARPNGRAGNTKNSNRQ